MEYLVFLRVNLLDSSTSKIVVQSLYKIRNCPQYSAKQKSTMDVLEKTLNKTTVVMLFD